MASLKDALKLHVLGWRVVAAPTAGKAPLGNWKKAQTEPGTKQELQKSFGNTSKNIFIVCGQISQLAVLDCDDIEAEEYWQHRLGSILAETTCATTGKGHHYYFSLAEGEAHKSRSSAGGESGKWDLRADGGGVIAPPSVHPSGKVYRWVQGRDPKAIQPAPVELWIAENEPAEVPSSHLAELLNNPPLEGGRNNWLAKVAGHLAKELRFEDAFAEAVRQFAPPGLETEEIEKLIRSIWHAEQSKSGKITPDEAPEGEGGAWRITEPTEDTGWLVSGDTRILVQARERDEDTGGWQSCLKPWLNADVRVDGVFEMDDDTRTYHVEIRTPSGTRETDVSSRTIGHNTKLSEWLAGLGLGLAGPDGMFPRGMSHSSRFTRYLEAQEAPTQRASTSLGWNDETAGFLTHDGLLRADGWHPHEVVRPAPRIRQWAPYTYGLEEEDASAALREALTFHFPQTTAVFGSWWAACLLKPQIAAVFSQFPVMAIEAASESGKSTGFFPLMLELSGNTQGKSVPTKAALRDYLSAHRNGIVWVDDVDDIALYGELIRATTVEGSLVKKGTDHMSQMALPLRAALVISGESLGLSRQKALADRAVNLRIDSPVERQSMHGEYSQWEDILTFKSKYPSLTDFAGTYVIQALQSAPEIQEKAQRMRETGGGRVADMLSTVRLGAWLLEKLADIHDHAIETEIDRWANDLLSRYNSSDNTLTTVLLPEALRRLGIKSTPEGPDPYKNKVATPVFVSPKKEIVWFSPTLLASWWSDLKYNRIEQRTESASSLEEQARACGAGGKKGRDRRYWEYSTGGGGCTYWKLPFDLGKKVIERSQGG